MRIAFVPAARLLSDRAANGEGLIAVGLLRRLAARGYECIAYCETADFEHPIAGVDVREIPAIGRTAALSRINFARGIARDAARERFDIAHVLFPFSTHEGYSLVRGAPLVAGPIFLPWPETFVRKPRLVARAAKLLTDPLERRMHARTLARAARLMVTGASSRAAIPQALHDRCVDVPFGVDPTRFPVAPMPEEPTIVFLSVLQERKGIEVLVRAMSTVRARIPRARLLVAGDDPTGMRPRLEALAEQLGVRAAIQFTGPVAPRDVAATYARARVFCQPSIGEPFGMTVIEAMACGRPVVGTAAGGIPDAVIDGRGGRLAPPGDARLLADALIRTLEHPAEAAAMGAFNRARVERRYSLDVIVDQIELTYEALAASRAERAPAHAA